MLKEALNEGGILYFRDYALYDMAQIRFASKKKSKVDENLYVRRDYTLSYFFSEENICALFKENGFEVLESKLIQKKIENRKDAKVMYRKWLQVKLRKVV